MINGITLTSSMRTNLLSLKTIATQMDKTQNILSTGKKVNSAIDHASSYYQARALINRASDLNNLLDRMGQGIQTIQAATQSLTNLTKLIDQATVIANQVYEIAEKHNAVEIPTKEWFIEQVGANGAVVSTAQELKDAINSNKETICVYGKIDYFENESITLKDGQKLVGTEYFTGYSGVKERFSCLNMTDTLYSAIGSNTEISDIDLNMNFSNVDYVGAFGIHNRAGNMNIRNINFEFSGDVLYMPIVNDEGNLTMEGKIDIIASSGEGIIGITNGDGYLNIKENTELNIEINSSSMAMALTLAGEGNIGKDSVINITTNSSEAMGIICATTNVSIQSTLNIENGVKINVKDIDCLFAGFSNNNGEASNIDLAKDVEISSQNNGVTKSWITSEDNSIVFDSDNGKMLAPTDLDGISSFQKQDKEFSFDHLYKVIEKNDAALAKQNEQYSNIINELDKMLVDSSYQGVNLLTGGELQINFNESRTHELTIKGKDMRSDKLGIKATKWETKEDVKNTLNELLAATNAIRNFQSELGEYSQIIQTRQNFTDALADVLEVGADNLVLADMNEASSEYLALQTRQELAVNSLSLAAQSLGSILSVF